jgi:hypothetical protein
MSAKNAIERILVVVAPSFLLSPPSDAATIFLTNKIGGNWSAARSWSPNQTPGTADISLKP